MSSPGRERWRRLEALFEELLDLPAGARAERLAAARAEEAEIAREVEQMLAAHERDGGPLDGDPRSLLSAALDGPGEGGSPATPPLRDGRYRLVREVGRGGMGVVWEAWDERLLRPLALKFLPAGRHAGAESRRRFLAEARAASALEHPAICTVYDLGETGDGRQYIAMAYHAGRTLERVIADGPVPVERAVRWTIEIAAGLECAHRAGIVHRDLKPSNLLLTDDGRIKILDFGVAKLRSAARATASDVRLGTPAYMAPEQARGEPVDARTDLFALGAVLYELLTGRRAFDGGTAPATMYAVIAREPEPVDALRPGLPAELAEIVARCLAKEPGDRPASAAEVSAALAELAAGGRPAPPGSAGAGLPAPAGRLFGREEEIRCLVEELGRRRLITLTGPGGTGKTRLALAAAAAAAGGEDGLQVHFVSLSPLADPSAVPTFLASALGVKETATRSPVEALALALARGRRLLVLDNFEQVVDAAPVVAELLAACPRLSVLVTSRVVLRLSAERVFPVPPLPLPPEGRPPGLDDLERSPATALFLDRLRAAAGDRPLPEDEVAAIAELCRRLDGLPLAIELAAARARTFSPRTLLSRLGRRLDLSGRGPRDKPPRHRTLRQAIDWSYELLEPAHRSLFRRLGIFVGGFDLEGAEAVCGESGGAALLDGVELLLDHSLLRQEPGGGGRFAMLETVRELALEKLEEAGERQPAERDHAAWTVGLAESGAEELTGSAQGRWVERLRADSGNLRAALDRAEAAGDVATALRLGGALWRFWLILGQLGEGRRRLEELLAMPGADDHPELAVRVLQGLGTLLSNLGENRAAAERLQAGLELCRTLEDRRGLAAQLAHLGWVATEMGDLDRAERLSAEALELNRELGDRRGEAAAHNNLGWIAIYRSRYAAAREHLDRSLELRRRLGDRRGTAFALSNLAWAEERTGRFAEAAARLREAEELFAEVDDRLLPGWTLDIAALVAQGRGEHEEALRILDRASAVWAEADNPSGLAVACALRAGSLVAVGRSGEALDAARESLAMARRVGSAWLLGGALLALARATLAAGDPDTAAARGEEAVVAFAEIGDRRGVAEGRELLAAVARARGEEETAARLAREAAEMRRAVGAPPP